MHHNLISFQNIVLSLPARERRRLQSDITKIQELFNDKTDLISTRSGKHFALRQVRIEAEAGPEVLTLDRIEAAKYFNISTFELSRRLTMGKGEARLTVPNKKTYGVDAFIVTRLE